MPADMTKLVQCLEQMKQTYLNDPKSSVRGQSFIYHLHRYCVDELYKAIGSENVQKIPLEDMRLTSGKPHYPTVTINPQKYQLMQEATLFGSHKNKDEDIVLTHFSNGPQIAIGVRSQMSSVGKNLENYYEGIIGECISLHDRFPMATLGYVYLLPERSIKPGCENEVIDLQRAESLFKKITERKDWNNPHDRYEHFAFIKVDFFSNPPRVIESSPELSITSFFDKLIKTHNDRNLFNQI